MFLRTFLLLISVLLAWRGETDTPASPPAPALYSTPAPTTIFQDVPTTNLQQQSFRAFVLEKETFLLGEPIVVELRVWPRTGSVTWFFGGGAYRHHGRDDNFAFLMRDVEGNWLECAQYGGSGGGLISPVTATSDSPVRVFNAVQRWCVIPRPGEYDLLCFYRESGLNEKGEHRNPPPDRALPVLPEPVKAWLAEIDATTVESIRDTIPSERFAEALLRWDTQRNIAAEVRGASDLMNVKIVVREGTDEERGDMVEAWGGRVDVERRNATAVEGLERNRLGAIIEGIYFEQHPCWLPTLVQEREKGGPELLNGIYVGVLLNPHREAVRLALGYPDKLLAYWEVQQPPGLMETLADIYVNDSAAETRSRAKIWLDRLKK